MEIALSLEPLGGGEADYGMIVDLPTPPREDGHIHAKADGEGFAGGPDDSPSHQ